VTRHASREPQYAHLNARAKRRDTRVATGRMRPREAHGATLAQAAGSGPAAASPAFRPHPVADPVKLRVSAH